MDLTAHLEQAAQALKAAEAVLITAGAGSGVDSGLPDFRGQTGFWKAYPPIAKLGLSFSQMANPHWFATKPRLAWAFYGHRLQLYRRITPHQGFFQLKEIVASKPGGYFVFTSNVDGHFQKAGFAENRIVECHGSIHHLQCTRICSNAIWEATAVDVIVDEDRFEAQDPLPHCIHCGALARPNILMFGDWSWIPDHTQEQEWHFSHWLNQLERDHRNLAIVEIGAGTAVPTVRLQSETVARRLGGCLIRINPRDFNVPHGQIPIPLGAAEGIYQIYKHIK